jgi:uncharacterized phage protein (TIGR02220 family)
VEACGLFSFMKNRDMAEIQPYRLLHPMLVRKTGPTAAVLFGELVNHATFHADGDGWFWLTQERITELLGIGEKATVNALEKLQQLDLLMIDTRGDKNRRHFRLVATTEAYLTAITDGQFLPNDGTSSAKRTEPVPAKSGNEFLPNDGTSSCQTEEQVPAKGRDYKKVIEEKVIEEKVIEEKRIEEKQIALSRSVPASKKKIEKEDELEKIAAACVENLNTLTGRRFEIKEHNTKLYKRLLVKGATFDDIELVHQLKTHEWTDSQKMRKHICPKTLTANDNFWRYLDDARDAKRAVENGTYGKTQQEIATEQAFYQGAINFVPPHLRKY